MARQNCWHWCYCLCHTGRNRWPATRADYPASGRRVTRYSTGLFWIHLDRVVTGAVIDPDMPAAIAAIIMSVAHHFLGIGQFAAEITPDAEPQIRGIEHPGPLNGHGALSPVGPDTLFKIQPGDMAQTGFSLHLGQEIAEIGWPEFGI